MCPRSGSLAVRRDHPPTLPCPRSSTAESINAAKTPTVGMGDEVWCSAAGAVRRRNSGSAGLPCLMRALRPAAGKPARSDPDP